MSISPKTPKAAKAAPKAAAKAPKAKKAVKAEVVDEQMDEAEVVAKPAAKAAAKAAASVDDAALATRLAEMTDFALRAYQQSTMRISRDPKHAKSVAAKVTLAAIEREMARRVASPGSAPSGVRVGVARPKQGKKGKD